MLVIVTLVDVGETGPVGDTYIVSDNVLATDWISTYCVNVQAELKVANIKKSAAASLWGCAISAN
jgi:hypothetical protein